MLASAMALDLMEIRRDIRRTAALLNTKVPDGLDVFLSPRRSILKSLKYPTLAFTKYAETIPDAEKQPKAHHENVFRKVPGIGTYTLGTKTTKNYDKGEQDMRRELSDIRRHEIPKNHNTPINEREFTWEREQKRLILQDQEARKDARHLQRPSKSKDGVWNVAKSHDGVLNREDIDTFDYHKLKKGSKNARQPKRDNFLLPQLSEPQKAGSSSLVDVRNNPNAYEPKINNTIEESRELNKQDAKSKDVEDINPDLVQLGWKDSREIKKTAKLKKTRKRKDRIEDVEGHLRYQNGVLLPKKSYEGSNDAETQQADNNKDASSEEKAKYCRCEQSQIDKLLCEECNLHGGKHKVWCSRWQRTVQGFVTCDICGKIRKRTSTLESQGLPTLPTLSSLKRSHDSPDKEQGEEGAVLKLPNIKVTNKALRKVMLAARFLAGAQVDASNNLNPERYLARINEKFDRGDFDWNNDVPDVNKVNSKLQLQDDDKNQEQAEIQNPKEVEMEIDEFPSYRKQQNGLTLYPNGVKEAYLKALQAAQMAKLDSFLSLQHRISKPFVFSYFDNVPRTGISSLAVCTPIREHKAEHLILKGKRAEMKHIFGKINPDDYYPGQKKNPVRKKKIKVKTEYESQYLTTDRKPFVGKTPETARLPRKSKTVPDHTHANKITSLVMGSTAGE